MYDVLPEGGHLVNTKPFIQVSQPELLKNHRKINRVKLSRAKERFKIILLLLMNFLKLCSQQQNKIFRLKMVGENV